MAGINFQYKEKLVLTPHSHMKKWTCELWARSYKAHSFFNIWNEKKPNTQKNPWNAKVQNIFFFNFSPFKLVSGFWDTCLLVAEIIRLKIPCMSAGKEISLLTVRSVLQRCCHTIDFFWSLYLYYWLSQQWRYFLYFFVSVLLGSGAET